jgi:hypothetical protein
MAPERVVLCGGTSDRGTGGKANPITLDIYSAPRNVHVGLEAIRRELWTEIPKVLRDLVDVALYVYAADQAVDRADGGRVDGTEIGAGWRRRFRFRIPVREVELWTSYPVRDALVSVLSFLSEDEYCFEFAHLRKDTSLAGFIDFDESPLEGKIDEVMMFSGGLDSLAGAVTESVVSRKRVLLVNHRPTEKLTPHHERLVNALRARAGDRAPAHFAVRANKAKRFGREFTQRTRSFLFAAFGTLFARMAKLDRLRFFENGVTSLNLPPSAQVVGARASRTTHPRVLAGFQHLLTTLLGRPFVVENPFLWETKTGVVNRIAAADCGKLIGMSISCGHTWDLKSRTHTHCGVCSQCVDRRFAVLAAGQESNDPADRYGVDLLTGRWEKEEAATMLAGYLALAERVDQMGDEDFRGAFGELARALPHLGLPLGSAASRVFELYRTHARSVGGVIERAIATHARAIKQRLLPPSCLLRIAFDDRGSDEHTPPAPARPEGNYLIRKGHFWEARYEGGEEKTYNPDIGFEYLRILLGNPATTYTACELASRVSISRGRRPPAAEIASREVTITPALGADPVMDDEEIRGCELRLLELDEAIPLALASDSEARLEVAETLEKERRDIKAELRKAGRRKGPRKKLGDERDKVRKRVCAAVTRAIARIAVYDTPLAEHLARPALTMGHHLCYRPGDSITWETGS